MTDEINFCLINNNEGKVENISDINVNGIKGEGSNRAQKVDVTLIKDTKGAVSGVKGVTYVARDYNKPEVRLSEQVQNVDNGSSLSPNKDQPNKDSLYLRNFEELAELGSGGFGTVYKVRDKLDDQVYAVKKVLFEDNNLENEDFIVREVKTLAKISSDKVVRYFHPWVEDNCLFIKMEFCSDNLKNTIQQKREAFQRQDNEPMGVMEFYTSFQMAKDLLECVQFLHELSPPIIHRDLKPHNVLISLKPINGKYLKLCDFGLAVVHDNPLMPHTAGVGTLKYMAPEIMIGNYGVKVDIYSLGRIIEDLFDLDTNNSQSIQSMENELKEKFTYLNEMILSMTRCSPFHNMRLTCAQVLESFNCFGFEATSLKNRAEFDHVTMSLKNNGYQIFLDYLTN